MKKYYFLIFFTLYVFLSTSFVLADSSNYVNCKLSSKYLDKSYTYDFYNFKNLSDTVSDYDVKIYSYYRKGSDTASDYDYDTYIFVSNVPFSLDVKRTLGLDVFDTSFLCNTIGESYRIKGYDCYSTSLYGSVPGYYSLQVYMDKGYYSKPINGFTKFIDGNNDDFCIYHGGESLPVDYANYLYEDFFHLPPTLNYLPMVKPSEGMTAVGEVIYNFLLSGVGLVILLIAFLAVLSLLVRYFRRSLNL